jgi:hypothetical protein
MSNPGKLGGSFSTYSPLLDTSDLLLLRLHQPKISQNAKTLSIDQLIDGSPELALAASYRHIIPQLPLLLCERPI